MKMSNSTSKYDNFGRLVRDVLKVPGAGPFDL
jgi:hypothetical protein